MNMPKVIITMLDNLDLSQQNLRVRGLDFEDMEANTM